MIYKGNEKGVDIDLSLYNFMINGLTCRSPKLSEAACTISAEYRLMILRDPHHMLFDFIHTTA